MGRQAQQADHKVKAAAAKTKKFVVEHKEKIIEVAAIGGAILAGIACTAVTAGVGAVACMVGAGALINLAKDAAQGDIHSIGDALGSVGTGALSGLIGGAGGAVAARIGTAVASKVGAGIGGRMVTEAAENGVEDVFSQAATTGRVDMKSAALGMVPGLGLVGGKSKSGKQASGLKNGTAAAGISLGGRGGGGGCPTPIHSFAPSTQVLMADGTQRPISDVNVGDKVLATDPTTDRSAAREVTQLHRNIDRKLSDVTVVNQDGKTSTLKTTQNHPFWNESEKRWAEAKDLATGKKLKAEGVGSAVVRDVKNYLGVTEMHDLTVAEIHTYHVVVSDEPILVHNNDGCINGRPGGPDGRFQADPARRQPGDADGDGMLSGTNDPGYVTSRPKVRTSMLRQMWNDAPVGPNGGRMCRRGGPNCVGEVMVAPGSTQPRDWDHGHDQGDAWSDQRFPPDVDRSEVIDRYHRGGGVECIPCNRGAGAD